MSRVIPPGRAGYLMGGSPEGRRVGNIPIGTYISRMSITRQGLEIDALHPVSCFCQGVNDKLLMLWFPFSHLSIRGDDTLDVVVNILHLALLAV